MHPYADNSPVVDLPQPWGSGRSLDYWLTSLMAQQTADFPAAVTLCHALIAHSHANPESWNLKQGETLRNLRDQIKELKLRRRREAQAQEAVTSTNDSHLVEDF